MADMDAITREALKRASQLHSRTTKQKPAPEPKPAQKENQASRQEPGFLGSLFKDKDRSIILMLLVLLMGEDVEPSLLLALIYILL